MDPTADSVATTSALLYLTYNLDPVYEKWIHQQGRLVTFRYGCYYDMAKIVLSSPNHEKLLVQRLVKAQIWMESLREAPAIQLALGHFYDTYEIASAIIKLAKYLQKDPRPDHQLHQSFNMAERIIKTIIESSSAIKNSLDGGGWIDMVINSVFQRDLGVDGDTTSIPRALKSVVHEDFMEEWAGEVVDSWKDSAKGFAYFKSE